MINVEKTNFFIVGAPKSGTTALVTYLTHNPEVYMFNPKEPNWFCTDFPELGETNSLLGYHNFFSCANDKHKAVGEASTIYLYSKAAAENIFKYNSNSKIIIMVRNPVQLVYS